MVNPKDQQAHIDALIREISAQRNAALDRLADMTAHAGILARQLAERDERIAQLSNPEPA